MKHGDDIPANVTAREGYSVWAHHYDAHDNPMTAMVEHAIARRGPDLRGADVLELGCGTGRNALAVRALGCARYVGIDDSPEMLAIVRERIATLGDCALHRRDLRATWWDDLGTFDAALISLVLEHLDDVAPVLGALERVVRPGGAVWILELHPELHARGVRAHVQDGDRTLTLPSFCHPPEQLLGALGDRWEPVEVTDWFATEEVARRSPKLDRYRGQPVLLEVRAARRSTRSSSPPSARQPAPR